MRKKRVNWTIAIEKINLLKQISKSSGGKSQSSLVEFSIGNTYQNPEESIMDEKRKLFQEINMLDERLKIIREENKQKEEEKIKYIKLKKRGK